MRRRWHGHVRAPDPGDEDKGPRCRQQDRLRTLPIIGDVGKTVDTVRKQEHRELMKVRNETLCASSTCG